MSSFSADDDDDDDAQTTAAVTDKTTTMSIIMDDELDDDDGAVMEDYQEAVGYHGNQPKTRRSLYHCAGTSLTHPTLKTKKTKAPTAQWRCGARVAATRGAKIIP
jgi:hypothetical protein